MKITTAMRVVKQMVHEDQLEFLEPMNLQHLHINKSSKTHRPMSCFHLGLERNREICIVPQAPEFKSDSSKNVDANEFGRMTPTAA